MKKNPILTYMEPSLTAFKAFQTENSCTFITDSIPSFEELVEASDQQIPSLMKIFEPEFMSFYHEKSNSYVFRKIKDEILAYDANIAQFLKENLSSASAFKVVLEYSKKESMFSGFGYQVLKKDMPRDDLDLVMLSILEIPKVLRNFVPNYSIYVYAPNNTCYLFAQ